MKLKPALLIAVIALTAYSCTKKSKDVIDPTFSTPLAFSGQTANSLTLTWTATDGVDGTPDDDLSYKVVYSIADNISTEADAEANGTVVQDWTINSLTANITALNAATIYFVTVMVRDSASNTTLSSGSASTLCAGKVIFLAAVPNGNLGAPAGADTLCNSLKPTGFNTSTFKAMLVDLTTRRACYVTGNDNCGSVGTTGRLDWVLGASQPYCSSDYTVQVGTTNANSYLEVLTANTLSATTVPVYTGFNAFWGTSTENCSGFLSSASTSQLGTPNGTENGSTAHSFITNGSGSCNVAGKIYCVEQ